MAVSGVRRTERVAEVAARHVARGNFASVEWLALRDGREWLRGKVGLADPHSSKPLPENPIYRIYSMTKPVVSAIVMMLVEEGIVHLYDPVGAWIPAFSRPEVIHDDGTRSRARNNMLVEHLLTHTSGLSYGFLRKCKAAEFYRKTDLRRTAGPLEKMIETIAGLPLAFEPGAQWRYSVATDVLARIVEIATGKPIQTVFDERVAKPLGLVDTGYMVRPEARDRLMPVFGTVNLDDIMVFSSGPQQLTPADVSEVYPADRPDFGRGGYGLFSTIDEYALIAQFLATGRSPSGDPLLGRKTVEWMWTNRIDPGLLPLRYDDFAMPGFGFGLAGRVMIDTGKSWSLSSEGEFGWAGAASTWFMIDPREKIVAITMSQYLGSKFSLADDMRNAIYSLVE
jgi:CubicO group peptidase (beta-lactamase class C family)